MTLPSGAVSFLFTGIEAGAALAQSHPAELHVLPARRHLLLHESIARHDRHVFRTAGDAFRAASQARSVPQAFNR